MKNDKTIELLAALALLAGAWYLYTRSKGLTITGGYANTMMPAYPVTGNAMSPVAPSSSSSTAALNVFSAISKGIATLGAALTHKTAASGNGPTVVPDNPAGIVPSHIGSATGAFGADYISEALPAPDTSLDESLPFWQWDFSFDRPPATPNYAALAYTITPDMAYIPPPPGA